jgi:NADH-quinone oxidoreductase subunit E
LRVLADRNPPSRVRDVRVLTPDSVELIHREVKTYPQSRSALLPALHIAQNQIGRITDEALEDVADILDLPVSDVQEVVTFYTMFYEDNVGTYVLEVCKTVPCGILGADEIIDHIAKKLNIQPGETTRDGVFTLLKVECLAGCHRAPVMQINSRYYENLTTEKVDALLDLLRQNAPARAGQRREEGLPALG